MSDDHALQPDETTVRRPTARWLWPVVAAAAAAVIVAAGLFGPWRRPAPAELLNRVLDAYAQAQTYHGQGTVRVSMEAGSFRPNTEEAYETWFRRPNLFVREQGEGMQASRTVCDGKLLYCEVPYFRTTFQTAAPANLSAVADEPMLGSVGDLVRGVPSANALLGGTVDRSSIAAVTAGVDPHDPWLAGLPQPERSVALTVKLSSGRTLALWVRPRSRTVVQMAMTLRRADLDESLQAVLPTLGMSSQDAATDELLGQLVLHVVTTDRAAELDREAPPATFSYQPPEGFTVREVADLASLRTAIMKVGDGATELGAGDGPVAGLVGQAAPEFAATTLDGTGVKLSAIAGKPTILVFWATWAGPCRDELPLLAELYHDRHEAGLQIVAVAGDDNRQTVTGYLAEQPLPFTVWWLDPHSDEGRRVKAAYALEGVPRTLYLGADGKVKADTAGAQTKVKLLEHVKALGLDTAAGD